jgi:hypothetical protein
MGRMPCRAAGRGGRRGPDRPGMAASDARRGLAGLGPDRLAARPASAGCGRPRRGWMAPMGGGQGADGLPARPVEAAASQ